MSKFKVRCTKSRDNRFIKGKIYDVQDNGRLFDEYGRGGCFNTTESFKAWYKDCHWTDYSFELVSADRHELHITSDGTTTNAVYKLNGKVEKTAKAVCCPSDTFNFNTGAELAINRVLYGTDYNPREVAFKEPMQNQPKEAVTLYCVKDFFNWNKVHWLKKGESYTIDENGTITGENGAKFSGYGGYSSFDNFKELNPDMGACLIRAEKRPALVGEWVLIVEPYDWQIRDYGAIKNGIYQVKEVMGGCIANVFINAGRSDFAANSEYNYLVLPDYTPEKVEPTYYSGKVVCVDNGGKSYTAGKVYEIKDGFLFSDWGIKNPVSSGAVKSVEDLNSRSDCKFIEYRGEQSC